MAVAASPIVDEAVAAGTPLLFLSAHLDDAVLSCGALIESVKGACPVTVATLFTAATCPPHTRAARSFLRQCDATSAAELFEERRAEDVEVLRAMGVEPVHLGVTDALFRRRDLRGVAAWAERVLPEVGHRYPTYRFDIAKGRVSRGDRAMIDDLAVAVAELVDRTGYGVVYCPVGVGRHVDHLITRAVGSRQPVPVVYYSDFPYNQASDPDGAFLDRHRLTAWAWSHGVGSKERLIRGYRTQVGALFPDQVIAPVPELYYEPAAIRAA